MSNTRPNILFIMTDQHRVSGVGAYGDTVCKTPNIDRLASEGMLFENAYCVAPLCSPVRATMMTGVYPHTHGVCANIHEIGCSIHELEDRPSLLPRRLQSTGYSTGYTGKWHLGTIKDSTFGGSNTPSLPSNLGFEGEDFPAHGARGSWYKEYRDWGKSNGFTDDDMDAKKPEGLLSATGGRIDLPSEYSVPGYLVHNTIKRIEDFQNRKRPFFFSLNFWGPHEPYESTAEFVDMYKDVDIPPWPNYDWPSAEIPGPHQVTIYHKKEEFEWKDWVKTIKYYYAGISLIDSQIGRLYNYLKESGLLENTVIIFTADHGETLGSHGGLINKGWTHFEETNKIPLIIRMPDGAGTGKRCEKIVSQTDIFPTILELASNRRDDTMKEEGLHGKSLLPFIQEKECNWRDYAVTEFLGIGGVNTTMKTLRWKNLKYGFNITSEDELYDLEKDPHEITNQINNNKYQGDLQQMRQILIEWMKKTGDPTLPMFKRKYPQSKYIRRFMKKT